MIYQVYASVYKLEKRPGLLSRSFSKELYHEEFYSEEDALQAWYRAENKVKVHFAKIGDEVTRTVKKNSTLNQENFTDEYYYTKMNGEELAGHVSVVSFPDVNDVWR